MGPTVATQASIVGIPALYLGGAFIMFLMVGAMYLYVERFGVVLDDDDDDDEESKLQTQPENNSSSTKATKPAGKEEGIMEGFNLFYEHNYVKGIFAISSFFMIQGKK